MDKSQIRINKDMMASMQRFELSLNDTVKILTSRAPLDSMVIYPMTRSPTITMRPVKRENLSRSYLCLVHSTWARWWRSCPSHVGTPFLIAYSCSCLMKTHILLPHTQYGKASFRHIFTYPFLQLWGKLHAYSLPEISILNLHIVLIKLESFLLNK